MARLSEIELTTGTGVSTANPLPPGGPPSAWIDTATSAWSSSAMAARTLTQGPTPVSVGRVSTTRAPSAWSSAWAAQGHVEVEGVLGVAVVGLGARWCRTAR